MFLTIKKEGVAIYKEKASKFIGIVMPCDSAQQAKELLKELRNNNPGCVHVCYAYCLGSAKTEFKYSDDGEPSNSAGAPIYGQIRAFNLTNVLIAVVRYYGGTKLGVGGLIKAYKSAAKSAIEATSIIEDEDKHIIEIIFPYDKLPFVMNEIKATKVQVLSKDFTTTPKMSICIPISDQAFLGRLKALGGIVFSPPNNN